MQSDLRQRFWAKTATAGVACMALMLCATKLLGMAGTSQIAVAGKPVLVNTNWPAGVAELLNDPLRANGWNPWFTELPNDVNFYEFKPQSPDRVKHLVSKFAEIKTTNLVITLSPAKEARGIGYTTVLKEGSGVCVMLSMGDQQVVDQWYSRLKEDPAGVRVFGVGRYTSAPVATPPTLTIYAGNPAVDLSKLQILSGVTVTREYNETFAAEHKDDAGVKVIEEFMAKRGGQKKAEDGR